MDEQMLPYDILRFDHKERLADRFLTTHLHRFEMFHKPVAIAIVVEIEDSWHPSSEFGAKIVNDIVRAFQQSEANSFQIRFEESLNYVNRTVKDAFLQLNGPVSCVALLLEPDQVHSSGVGTAYLGLYRQNRLSTILGRRSPRTESFTSVVSGDLRQGDWLCLGNQNFSLELEDISPEFWQGDPRELLEYFRPSHSSTHEKSAGILLRFNQENAVVNHTIFWEEAWSDQATAQTRLNLSGGRSSSRPITALAGVVRQLSSGVATYWPYVRRLLPTPSELRLLPFKGRLRRCLPIGMVVLALIVGVLFFNHPREQDATDRSATQTLSSQVLAQPRDFRVKKLLELFSDSGYESLNDNEKRQLVANLQEQRVSLTELPDPVAQLSSEILALDGLDSNLAAIDNEGRVWIYQNSLFSKLPQNKSIVGALSLAMLSASSAIVTDRTGNLWLVSSDPDSPIAMPMPKTLPNTNKIVNTFRGNLYVTAPESNETFRVSSFSNTLAPAVIYKSGSDLPIGPITDTAVNGEVLALDSSGQLASFTKNKLGALKISLPFADGAWRLSAEEKSPKIVASSGRVVYLINPDLTLAKIIILATDQKITDLAVDPSVPDTLWIAIDKGLYRLLLS